MAVLAKTQLASINDKMLGLGAPVQIDGAGYNKVDYQRMFPLGGMTGLTDKQATAVCFALTHYKNTQLKEFAQDIVDSLEHYNQNPTNIVNDAAAKAVKAAKSTSTVKVVESTHSEIHVTWAYNKNVSYQLKNEMDKKFFHWKKDGSTWILCIRREYIKAMIEMFFQNGFNTDEMEEAAMSIPEVKLIDMKVIRPKHETDILQLVVNYNQDFVNAIKSTKKAYWDESARCWNIYIEDAVEINNAINGVVDTKELKPWVELVSKWSECHNLVDLSKYDLKFQPYDFQPQDAAKLLSLKLGLNANEVGCGKTFEQILIGESIPMKKLVICPPTLRLNWEREIHMVNPNANVHIIYSDQTFKTVDGWNIIGYSSLAKFQSELEAEMFQVVMMDEAHFIQAVNNYGTPDSQRAFAAMRTAATSQYVFPITGTPKTNRNKNLFNILKVLRHPLTRGKWAFNNFGKHFCNGTKNGYGWDFNGNSNDAELNENLKPVMVRHLKKDVLPHLKKQRQAIPVQVNLVEYHEYIDEYLEKSNIAEGEALVALGKAKQSVAIQKAKNTVEMAKEFVEEGKKVVIVTCYADVVDQVTKSIKGCLKIVGGMSDSKKQETIDKFQSGKADVIVINVVAGGTGVTLTAASTMIINDLPWTTGEIEQAEGRIWRGGQTETAMIYYPVAYKCEMDEIMVDTITNKSATINAAVDGGVADEIDLRKALDGKI